ncbi:acyl-CoA dehydrogenase family protein [Sorangium sp. So ce388]|uniref:acyl-CoA dehydrogenase family protein n=1 Tax=Sorangium sp. So ce388 TaxID=3133309 RepID=UPI003F5C6C94
MIKRRYTPIPKELSAPCADDLIAWLRSYAERRVNSRLIDERRCIPPYVVLDFANHGLLGVQVERKYGGLGLSNRDIARILEQVAAIDLGLGAWLTTSIFPGIRPIATFASEPLKNDILPQLARGRILGAYAQTEVGAGSDFTKISAKAVPTAGGGWKISGDKVWIGNGSWSGVMTVMAKVCNSEGDPADMAAFAVRTEQPGVVMGEELLSMGMRGMVQSKIHLRDVHVERSQLLGNLDDGVLVGVDSMMLTRFALGACAVGSMKRCLQLMNRFATRRSIGAGRLSDNPIYCTYLGELVAKTAAADALLYTVADLLDSDSAVPLEAFVACKMVSSEFLWEAADRLVQVLGSRGYDEANLAPQILRDARVFRIFEGTTEVLADFLGSRGLVEESSGVYGFLRNELASPEVADKVASCLSELRVAALSPRAPTTGSVSHSWRCALAGDVVAWAFLVASLNRRPSGTQPHIIEWARVALDAAIGRALTRRPDESALSSPSELSAAISRYDGEIGVVEQSLAGECREFDPLLRRAMA